MLQRRFGVLIARMAIVCSFLVALPALADSNVRIVRLSNIYGDAQVNHNDKDQGFVHAVLNMPVTSGMWLYTPSGGRAEVQFENGSTVRTIDDAQIQFEKLALANSGGKIDVINVDHGIVYLNFRSVNKDDQIRINASGRMIRITKPAHLRLDITAKVISIAALHGQAVLEGDDNIQIKENHTLFADPTNADHTKLVNGTDKFGSDMWDKNRDDELAVVATRSGPALGNGYDAQFSSLGYYGNFMAVPGYGNVWQPNGMGPGWDPFMNGMWGFYPGMGYSFISTYPWGWAPYRYGQWNYLSSYGWFWAPGATMNAFNAGPNYGTVPAGWRAPVQPTVGAGVKPTQFVVVGHPPNVHPNILEGRPALNAHPAPVALTPVRTAAGTAGRNANGGMHPANASASGRTNQHAGFGSASHPSGGGFSAGASHAASTGGGMGGHPK